MKKTFNISDNGFSIPENYFESISEDIQTKINEENLNRRFGKKIPFSVPLGYFNNISAETFTEKKPAIQLYHKLKPYLSIAAGIIIIFGIWQLLLTNIDPDTTKFSKLNTDTSKYLNTDSNNKLTLNDINMTDISNELDLYIDNTDELTLIEISNEEEVKNIEIDSEEIYNYLMDYADESEFNEIIAGL